MKYIKQYENIFDSKKYKKYIITKFKGNTFSDIYINLYENRYNMRNSFICLYYYDQETKRIGTYINKQVVDYIASDNIVYESDDLQKSIDALNKIIIETNQYIEMKKNANKYNI